MNDAYQVLKAVKYGITVLVPIPTSLNLLDAEWSESGDRWGAKIVRSRLCPKSLASLQPWGQKGR
jgi:hypothetical protein